MDVSLLSPFLKEVVAEHRNHKVWRDEPAVLIHEHHAVSVSVEDHSDVSLCLRHELFQVCDILLHKRIRLMVRE